MLNIAILTDHSCLWNGSSSQKHFGPSPVITGPFPIRSVHIYSKRHAKDKTPVDPHWSATFHQTQNPFAESLCLVNSYGRDLSEPQGCQNFFRRMLRILYVDRVKNKEVLQRVQVEPELLQMIKDRQSFSGMQSGKVRLKISSVASFGQMCHRRTMENLSRQFWIGSLHLTDKVGAG